MPTPVGSSVGLTGFSPIDGLTQGSKWDFPSSHTLTISIWDSSYGIWPNEAPQLILNAVKNFSNVADINFSFYGHIPLTNSEIDPDFLNNSSDISVTNTGNILSTNLNSAAIGIFPDPAFADQFIIDKLEIDPADYPTIEGDIFIDNFCLAPKFCAIPD